MSDKQHKATVTETEIITLKRRTYDEAMAHMAHRLVVTRTALQHCMEELKDFTSQSYTQKIGLPDTVCEECGAEWDDIDTKHVEITDRGPTFPCYVGKAHAAINAAKAQLT